MARARNIKPGLYKNEELAECSVWARYIFPGMWMLADRAGRMEDRPKRIKGELLPYDPVEVEPLLAELAKYGFIVRYEVDGQRYIQITKFSEHQSPHVRESESIIPAPDGTLSALAKAVPSTVQGNGEASPRSPDSLIPSSLNPDSGLLDECAEPQSDSTPKVIDMPLVGDKVYPIHQRQVDEWTVAYPAVDIVRQLAAMRQWCLANPTLRKTERGVMRFCNSWLMKEQDKPRQQPRAGPYPSKNDRSGAAAAIFGTSEPNRGIIDVN
jgi:hypothetical protein